MNKISELRPFQKRVEVTIKIVEKGEVREVTSRLDNSTHKVSEATIGDDSGTILLTLWDDMIDKVDADKNYKITNGYTSLFKNTLRMNIGRYGQIEESTDEIGEVNKENNMSEKEFQQRRRFEGGGSRGGFQRGGFGGRSSGPRKEFNRDESESSESEEESSEEEESGDFSEDEE